MLPERSKTSAISTGLLTTSGCAVTLSVTFRMPSQSILSSLRILSTCVIPILISFHQRPGLHPLAAFFSGRTRHGFSTRAPCAPLASALSYASDGDVVPPDRDTAFGWVSHFSRRSGFCGRKTRASSFSRRVYDIIDAAAKISACCCGAPGRACEGMGMQLKDIKKGDFYHLIL